MDIFKIIENLLRNRKQEINDWFESAARNTPPFFYNSVDLRHAGFKLAPVDTNLFPAGFNNLTNSERNTAKDTVGRFLQKYHHDIKKILIIPEMHTRNRYYLENLAVLNKILNDAGIETRIAYLLESDITEHGFTSLSGIDICMHSVINDNGCVSTLDGFIPDLILLNNDLTHGTPDVLEHVKQIISPATNLGWHLRRKTLHFDTYNNMARDFAHIFEFDSWLISTYFARCGVLNFKEKKGFECIALNVDRLINKIQNKYSEYGIKETPYVFIKSDMGTYGMGIMTARSGDEVMEMGRKIRKKMDTIKGGTQNTDVIIQEGVPTIDNIKGQIAEPMIYLMGGEPVGCIYRTNSRKDAYGNLNSSGMGFSSFPEEKEASDICSVLGLVARLASYSAAWECYIDSYSI